jgi:hypothetical protein
MVFYPGEGERFYEQVSADGLQLTVELNMISKGQISYRITHPSNASHSDKQYKKLTKGNAVSKFSGKGDYIIEIVNTEEEPVYFSLGSYVDKEFEVDENTAYIKGILEKLRGDLRSIYTSNLRLKDNKEMNIKEAKNAKWRLSLLCFIAVIYGMVGFVKLHVMKSFFTPRKGL